MRPRSCASCSAALPESSIIAPGHGVSSVAQGPHRSRDHTQLVQTRAEHQLRPARIPRHAWAWAHSQHSWYPWDRHVLDVGFRRRAAPDAPSVTKAGSPSPTACIPCRRHSGAEPPDCDHVSRPGWNRGRGGPDDHDWGNCPSPNRAGNRSLCRSHEAASKPPTGIPGPTVDQQSDGFLRSSRCGRVAS
jgi:hypothetical protein